MKHLEQILNETTPNESINDSNKYFQLKNNHDTLNSSTVQEKVDKNHQDEQKQQLQINFNNYSHINNNNSSATLASTTTSTTTSTTSTTSTTTTMIICLKILSEQKMIEMLKARNGNV